MKQIKLAVIGGPALKISRSADVHRQFGLDNQLDVSMDVYQVDSEVTFLEKLKTLQAADYLGVSIAQPYKEFAVKCCNELSERAQSAGAVNAIKFCNNGKLYGDNTDGLGLIRDIKNQYHISIKNKRVLLIGAGGVARGLLLPLVEQNPKEVMVINRSNDRTLAMLKEFHQKNQSCQEIKAALSDFEHLTGTFDIIINTTSASLEDELPGPLSEKILTNTTLCYDVVLFPDRPTVFESWALNHGAKVANGLGMVVEQAALAFELWTGIYPKDTNRILKTLRDDTLYFPATMNLTGKNVF